MFHFRNNTSEDVGCGDPDAGLTTTEDNKSYENLTFDYEEQGDKFKQFQNTRPSSDIHATKENSIRDPELDLLSFASQVSSGSKDDSTKQATIFGLCCEDRKRVGNLIAKLAMAQDNLAQLKDELEASKDREDKYRTKSSNLMKKVDALTEKCQRLEGDKMHLKEKHLEALTTLNSKVTDISDKFELSAQEIQRLGREKVELLKDNRNLRSRIASLENQLAVQKQFNQETATKLSLKLPNIVKTQKHKDKQKEKPSEYEKSGVYSPSHEKSSRHQCTDSNTEGKTSELLMSNNKTEDALLQDLFFRF